VKKVIALAFVLLVCICVAQDNESRHVPVNRILIKFTDGTTLDVPLTECARENNCAPGRVPMSAAKVSNAVFLFADGRSQVAVTAK
jgi:hypothetical protein